MRRLLLFACLVSLGCGAGPSDPQWRLVWADEFEGPIDQRPDASNWGFDIGTDWGNAQLEFDTDRASNASLDGDGHLRIVARREAFQGSAYTSARMTTEGKREFREGKFEARIKLPVGQGIWPAFWMLGTDLPTVGWPQSGEIDIMEYRGQEPSIVHGSLHGPGYSGGQALTRRFTLPAGRFDDDFHLFTITWTANEIRWYVDGELYQTAEPGFVSGPWVFNKPFYLILNVAVGGGFVGSPNSSTTFPQTMLVDWVRVYEQDR
ncbi:MAG: glycoside hydrolase family 16 protein [Gemmatimonadales bacterium]|nr:glycoside hydrolase family 16 protein [Gemmatimonadales bacterium]MDZ4388630.1 glycoside hydrolase family 16 protein [Gemmatimonadales bacterium]